MLHGIKLKILSSIIILLLLNFGKIVQGHNCAKKFYYKHPNQDVCLSCRICPSNIDSNLTDNEYTEKQCTKYPALPDGRLPHCKNTKFEIPSCAKLEPDVGRLVCDRENYFDSTCFLECPEAFEVSQPGNITCTTELTWNGTLSTCTKLKPVSTLPVAVIIAIVSSVIVGVIVVGGVVGIWYWCRQTIQNTDVENGDPAFAEKVEVVLENADKRPRRKCPNKHKWMAEKGSKVVITAQCKVPDLSVQYFVCLNLESRLSPVYTTLPTGPPQIPLCHIRASQHGTYSWIASLSDGSTVQGEFKISVIKRCTLLETCADSSGNSNEETSLTSQEDISLNTYTEVDLEMEQEAEAEGEINHEIDDFSDETTNREAYVNREAFHRLMRNRADVHELHILLDRSEDPRKVSWHTIAKSPLLDYDDDFVRFLEYHLKGQLHEGPMSHILTLMKQRGITVKEFVELLETYRPSSEKALTILRKYS